MAITQRGWRIPRTPDAGTGPKYRESQLRGNRVESTHSVPRRDRVYVVGNGMEGAADDMNGSRTNVQLFAFWRFSTSLEARDPECMAYLARMKEQARKGRPNRALIQAAMIQLGNQWLTSDKRHCTLVTMIKTFRHKGLKRLFEDDEAKLIGPDLLETVREILFLLDNADSVEALNLPGYRLHPLKGDRKGFLAMTVRANWRIIFRFEKGHAYDVEITDYH